MSQRGVCMDGVCMWWLWCICMCMCRCVQETWGRTWLSFFMGYPRDSVLHPTLFKMSAWIPCASSLSRSHLSPVSLSGLGHLIQNFGHQEQNIPTIFSLTLISLHHNSAGYFRPHSGHHRWSSAWKEGDTQPHICPLQVISWPKAQIPTAGQ